MSELISLIQKNASLDEISRFLDWQSHESRMNEIKPLQSLHFPKLFAKAKADLKLLDLIPMDHKDPVIFYGKNSLSFFNSFQKRMCRVSDRLIGYNHQSMSCITGPGYFCVSENSDKTGQLLFDYEKSVNQTPDSWPVFKSNNKGISKLIYGGLKDYLKRVSEDVFIGEAYKNNKIEAYFILCREDLPLKISVPKPFDKQVPQDSFNV